MKECMSESNTISMNFALFWCVSELSPCPGQSPAAGSNTSSTDTNTTCDTKTAHKTSEVRRNWWAWIPHPHLSSKWHMGFDLLVMNCDPWQSLLLPEPWNDYTTDMESIRAAAGREAGYTPDTGGIVGEEGSTGQGLKKFHPLNPFSQDSDLCGKWRYLWK